VSLASVRAPRLGNRQREEPDQPWAYEAKEFLRSSLIGQTVSVKVDYMRLVGENDRPFVTITHNRTNMSVKLIKLGLAEALRHRGDEDRAEAYDLIAEAEEEAKTKKLKIHNEGSAPPAHRFNEQSQTGAKAKAFLPHLQRQGKVRAIVDYVVNGGRLRLTLPDNASSISFGLSGVRCPGGARGEEKGDPFGDEAHHFTRLHCLQRDVEIEIEAADRGGTFLGTMWVAGQSLAVQLLSNGYAWCSDSVDRSPYCQQLESAQAGAQLQKLRVWEKFDPEAERRREEERAAAEKSATPNTVQIRPQFIPNGNTFFTHMLGPEAAPLLKMRAHQFSNGDFSAPGAGGRYRAGQYCSALYDGDMYRAKVLKHDQGQYEVAYLDYGGTGWCSAEDMQEWGDADRSQPPLAFECKLAYVKVPEVDADYGYEAGQVLGQYVGKDLTAQVVAKAGEVYHLMVFDGDKCVNAESLRSGCAMLTKDAKRNKNPSPELQQLMAAIDHAKKMRKNLWEYGDAESDDEDASPRRGAWGR